MTALLRLGCEKGAGQLLADADNVQRHIKLHYDNVIMTKIYWDS